LVCCTEKNLATLKSRAPRKEKKMNFSIFLHAREKKFAWHSICQLHFFHLFDERRFNHSKYAHVCKVTQGTTVKSGYFVSRIHCIPNQYKYVDPIWSKIQRLSFSSSPIPRKLCCKRDPKNVRKTRGRCYDHNFLRILTIFGEKIGVFCQKTILWSKFCIIYLCFE
jgi:hypothetical protein